MRLVLTLNRLTHWGLNELLALTWPELNAWLEAAVEMEKKING